LLQSSLGGAAPKEFPSACRDMVRSFLAAVDSRDSKEFHRALEQLLDTDAPGEDHSDLWQSAVSLLRLRTADLIPAEQSTYAENLLHQARLAVTDHAERLSLRKRLSISEINHQIGWMTTRMFSAGTEKDILRIFAEHLAEIGIRFAQVALFEPRARDPLGGITFFRNLWPEHPDAAGGELSDLCLDTADFPTAEILPPDRPYSLAVLPVVFQDEPLGFALFDTGLLEPLATIIRQLAAALKTQQLHAQAEELSLMDPATGVQNRRFFELFLQRELERCRRYQRGLTLMMIHLDGWKKFTAAHGPARSRDALRSLAQAVTACIRRGSDVVCRYSSETFAVLLPETDRAGALAIADSVRRGIRERAEFRDAFDVGIGIALAEGSASGADGDNLLAAGNRALYQAKAAGRDRTEVVRFASPGAAKPAPDGPGTPSL
jgi:diguanylate cyclase (GGDEF)-like protein